MIGLMSGTSGDGIDAALVAIKERDGTDFPEISLHDFLCVPFTEAQRARVFALFDPNVSADYVASMDQEMGEWFGQVACELMEKAKVASRDVAVIGSHGQTVCHHPHRRFTLQIGNPAVIARRTGCAVVADFRKMDMALGGQGAPLIPYFDYAYFRDTEITRVLLNVGGIGNITVLKKGSGIDEVVAFDTGPGNMVIDGAVAFLTGDDLQYDEDGRLAKCGRVDEAWVESLLAKDDYVKRMPPKSTGREDYGAAFVREHLGSWLARKGAGPTHIPEQLLADGVASMTYFVAKTVAQAVRSEVKGPFELLISGGGRHNRMLVSWIETLLRPEKIIASESFGVPSDAKEAMAFALFAWQFLHGRSVNIPSATGASAAAVLGEYTPSPGEVQ